MMIADCLSLLWYPLHDNRRNERDRRTAAVAAVVGIVVAVVVAAAVEVATAVSRYFPSFD